MRPDVLAAVLGAVALGAIGFLLWGASRSGSEPAATLPEEPREADASSERAERAARPVLFTNGVKHSIPLSEILSGGPPKDGIPSIDRPKFVSAREADEHLAADDPGLGLFFRGVARFYPYQILVWHEIVNDTIAGEPVLVTYCPLCATGIVFERRVGGVPQEFGVSGKLWQSNLLMYNRTGDAATESLWSQVLGEAVVGPETGERLAIIPADAVRYGDWKRVHPDTEVLSRETGALRAYGLDPYGDYYTSRAVSFGAAFSDARLHPKAFVFGVEIRGTFKAYPREALPRGVLRDEVAGVPIEIEKSEIGEVRFFAGPGREPLPAVGGFWFSWLAVHPDTLLFEPR